MDMPATPSDLKDKNSDAYWRARSDANTLTEAEAIKADKARLKNAAYILQKAEVERTLALKAALKASK
jgi:hypothetical protein